MALNEFIRNGQELLRCGYTTGSCATLGVKACGEMLLTQKRIETSEIMTPKGILVKVSLENMILEENMASCSVKKDGGDDFDVTHGADIVTTLRLLPENEIIITGGTGVGIVTKVGLDQPKGNHAINSVPRQMMTKELLVLKEKYDYSGGFHVEISVPQGELLAKKTFNPYMGILGGISILGTTGIVEPKSSTALLSSIEAELKMHRENGVTDLIITPGQYGSKFLKAYPVLSHMETVQISNFLGDSLDLLAVLGFRNVLLVGHIGKLVKVSAGIMNTHSKYGDGRREIFMAYSSLCGGSQFLAEKLMDSVTSDACLDFIEEEQILPQVLSKIFQSSEEHLMRRASEHFKIGVMMFTNVRGELGKSQNAKEILQLWESTLEI